MIGSGQLRSGEADHPVQKDLETQSSRSNTTMVDGRYSASKEYASSSYQQHGMETAQIQIQIQNGRMSGSVPTYDHSHYLRDHGVPYGGVPGYGGTQQLTSDPAYTVVQPSESPSVAPGEMAPLTSQNFGGTPLAIEERTRELLRIRLEKGEEGLGFRVKGRQEEGPGAIYVQDIQPGSIAERCFKLTHACSTNPACV